LNDKNMSLERKNILITGAGRRIGYALALSLGKAGANLVLHYNQSAQGVLQLERELRKMGCKTLMVQADLAQPAEAGNLISHASQVMGGLDALINNAAIFEKLDWQTTDLASWERHLAVNLTSPFFLSQTFARQMADNKEGRIVNILDWRALRPGSDHLPYTISKAGLAALTRSLAIALAPRITVNAVALGAILPPSDGNIDPRILEDVPLNRWAKLDEVVEAVRFFLDGPGYITGEILHVDGGRHLV
jgi:NAD(P)-dependent dehydrogenase (short-subunit alcohol dehydrogenase family)